MQGVLQGFEEESFDFIYKIVLSGDAGVGKSNFLQRYVKGVYAPVDATIGVEFATKTLHLSNGVNIKAQIWDTCKINMIIAGSERYRAITKGHYRKAVGALLIYDISNHQSFRNLEYWVEQLREHGDPSMQICIVGNKCDLLFTNPQARAVSKEEAKQFAEDNNLIYMEQSSALADINVKACMEALVERIFLSQSSVIPRGTKTDESLKLTFQEARPTESRCCV